MTAGDPRAALAAAAAARGESLAALSRMLGRNPAYLQQFVARGTPRRLDERDRRALASYLAISEAALGGEEMDASPTAAQVPRIDAAASAGPGALVEGDAVLAEMLFDPALLRGLGVREADASIIRATGDSMLPGIADGDLLLVDGARRLTVKGGVFVIRLDGVLLVKRIARSRGMVTIASDNPAATPIAPRPASEVDVLGAVVWLSRTVR
jgi:repressor LexA